MSRSYVQAKVLQRRTLDQVLLLAPDGDEIVHLAGTALAIWECFQVPTSIDAATRRLAADYNEDVGRLGPEVSTAVEALQELGALVASS